MKRKFLSILLTLGMTCSMLGCSSEKSEAKKQFEMAVSSLEDKEEKLDENINNLQEIIDAGEPVLDESVIDNANEAIKNAQSAKYEVPEMGKEVEEIQKQTKEIEAVSYEEQETAIEEAKNALNESIEKYKLVDCPTEDFVLKRVATVEHITGVQAVTEDHDPNGNLNKAGSYTATVYMSCDYVNKDELYIEPGEDIVDVGTDGGAAVEVYTCKEDAIKREEYLAGFDGTIFVSGSHKVVGTCLIRTSSYLTASQQKEIETAIIEALTKLN